MIQWKLIFWTSKGNNNWFERSREKLVFYLWQGHDFWFWVIERLKKVRVREIDSTVSLWTFSTTNCVKKKRSLRANWLIVPELIPGFCSMKRLGVFLLPQDGTLVHHRSFPHNLLGFPNNLPVPIYTPVWREALWELSVLPKNTTQCPQPGLEPRPFALGMSALTIRPLRLHTNCLRLELNFYQQVTISHTHRRKMYPIQVGKSSSFLEWTKN